MLQLSVPMDDADEREIFVDELQRYVLAGNPRLPVRILALLSSDPMPKIRRRVAENPAATTELLLRLALDVHAEVRMGVTENPHTPAIFLEQLSMDHDVDVRYFMSENVNLSEKILTRLVSDSNPYVSSRAAKTLAAKHSAQPRSGDLLRCRKDKSAPLWEPKLVTG